MELTLGRLVNKALAGWRVADDLRTGPVCDPAPARPGTPDGRTFRAAAESFAAIARDHFRRERGRSQNQVYVNQHRAEIIAQRHSRRSAAAIRSRRGHLPTGDVSLYCMRRTAGSDRY